MTELLKRKYVLSEVKKLIREGKIKPPNYNVQQDAFKIGFSVERAHSEILDLEPKDFFKSMDSNFNPNVWFDVYKKTIDGTKVYIKFQLVRDETEFLLS